MNHEARVIEHDQEVPFGDPETQPDPETPAANNALLPREQAPAPVIVDANPYVQMIAVAAARDVDIEKLEKLMDLQERWEDRKAKKEFVQAMAGFQETCPAAFRSNSSDKHDYAPIEVIMKTIRPHLAANGLSVRFDTEFGDDTMTAICKVAHTGGYEEISRFTCAIENIVSGQGKQVMNKSQASASADSYAKRYALKNAFNIVESYDDDGESLGAPPELITDQNVCVINEAIKAKVVDKDELLRFQKVKNLEDIPASSWPTINKLIQRKYKLAEKAND